MLKERYPDLPITEFVSQVVLQKKALAKLPYAEKWLWTDKNYQQASTFHLAKYHGSLFKDFNTVADLCCGIGSDLLFLSKGKRLCYAVDSDEDVMKLAQHNMAYFRRENIVYQNLKAEDFAQDCDAVFIDPDRRKENRRFSEIDKISPNYNTIKKFQHKAVKLSPILDYEDKIFAECSFDFVSVNGELKECLLRTGNLKSIKQAILLPQNLIFSEKIHPETHISPISNWLFEPDPAIIRAHLVNDLAYEQNLSRIDKNIALLTSETAPETVWGTRYAVNDTFDYNLKTLNNYLKSRNIGILDIKTRGFQQPVESFRKSLKLKGTEKAVLFIVRVGERHLCVVS